jgi:Ca-activated chloride channel family protein
MESSRTFKRDPGAARVVVLLTDGGNTAGDLDAALSKAAGEKITVHCVGIGAREGAAIPVKGGNGPGYVKDKAGNIVRSSLDEDSLKDIARRTGGEYRPAGVGAVSALSGLYADKLSKLAASGSTEMVKSYEERSMIFVWFAVVGVFVTMLL